jgi:hypothetical protein
MLTAPRVQEFVERRLARAVSGDPRTPTSLLEATSTTPFSDRCGSAARKT